MLIRKSLFTSLNSTSNTTHPLIVHPKWGRRIQSFSEKLGGKQVGTLLHSIAIQNGPAFFTSIPDTKTDTIGPLLVKQLPFSTPLFTDEGYPWLFEVYKNHRSVNHSAKSKNNRYRLAKNRWCREGVHNQVAEGNHRLVKAAFSSYGYILLNSVSCIWMNSVS